MSSTLETGLKNARAWRDWRREGGYTPTTADIILAALEGLPEDERERTVCRWAMQRDGIIQNIRADIARGWMAKIAPGYLHESLREAHADLQSVSTDPEPAPQRRLPRTVAKSYTTTYTGGAEHG